jgi:flavin reductase (DIM6/NTAB) family NADH-FMN oxidoreductase RutF
MHSKALFLYGTNKEDGTPNFGLFTWITGCWNGEESLMVCIGEPKLTKDRILATKIFSANLVSEAMLPLADYLGNNAGYTPGKMDIEMNVGRGEVLDVPVLKDSPLSYELEVSQHIPLLDSSDVFICRIRNTITSADKTKSIADCLRNAAPVVTVGNEYFTLNPVSKGVWGQWKNLSVAEKENRK